MSYPAYETFGKQIGRGFARWKVYMALQPPTLDFVTSRPIKTTWLADEAHVSRRHAIAALNVLVAHGYLIEHGRDTRGTRLLTLAYALPQRQAA